MNATQQLLFEPRPRPAARAEIAKTRSSVDEDETVMLGAASLNEFAQHWAIPCGDGRDSEQDIHWLIYCLFRAHSDDRGLAWPSLDQVQRESGLSADTIRAAIANLENPGCGMLERRYESDELPVRTRQVYHVATLSDQGRFVSVPRSLLTNPALLPATKRAAFAALIGGAEIHSLTDGRLYFSFPNLPTTSMDALAIEGRRQVEG